MTRCFIYILLLMLGGCTTAPVNSVVQRPLQPELSAFAFNGRVAVRHDGERTSAGVRWMHRGATDEILLLAPLGQTMARIYSDAQGVTLEESGKIYTATDAEALTERVLGWHLPLSGMRFWVLALPATGSEPVVERDASGQLKQLRQDGWEITYTRYAADAADSLPLRMNLRRDGMEIQLVIDEWEI